MSSHMVSNEIMKKVVTGLRRLHKDGYSIEGLPLKGPIDQIETWDRLGLDLFLLNDLALVERYGGELLGASCFSFRAPILGEEFSDIDTFKATSSLLYQCSEGSVPDSQLYKGLKNARATMAIRIVSKLPEYEASKWS